MKRSRTLDNLSIQGNKIQILADISPTTIQKRRALKPLLEILTQKSIKYRCPSLSVFSFNTRTSFTLSRR